MNLSSILIVCLFSLQELLMTLQGVFWDSLYMYPTQQINYMEHCVSRTPTLHQTPYLLYSPPSVLFMDNMSFTTTRDLHLLPTLNITHFLLEIIYVRLKYMVGVPNHKTVFNNCVRFYGFSIMYIFNFEILNYDTLCDSENNICI